MGYDIYLFVSRTAAEKFICAVCQGVAKDVFETDCGHLFCRTCVGKLIRVTTTNNTSAQCPHCRANVTWQNVHGSKFLNREISQLQCKCNLCTTWTGDLCKLSEHQLNECPDQFVDCVWKKYGCKETKIKRKDMAKHNETYKVQHLELKINVLQSQHQTSIQTIKRKYEQQISQLNEEKILIEKKWKQKLILIHKKYGVTTPVNKGNRDISISHIEQINISTSSTTNINNNNNRTGEVQYHSDGSISYDPNNNSNISLISPLNNNNNNRRKRKRSVLDEVGNNGNNNSSDSINDIGISGGNRKKIKKRRKVESIGTLGALGNGSGNRNITSRRTTRSMSVRKRKEINKKRNVTRRRMSNSSIESESNSGSGSGSESDSDQNMN